MARKKTVKNYSENIICAGFGGQGILFMGKLLAEAALRAGRHVTWMPSYGAEVRGGTAYSMTKISNEPIANPVVKDPTVLVVMNKPSLVKYEGKLKEGSVLIANKSLIGNIAKDRTKTILNIPMTEMATKIGNIRCANMIAVGAIVKRSKMVSLRNIVNALKAMLHGKEELFALNKKALEKGHKL